LTILLINTSININALANTNYAAIGTPMLRASSAWSTSMTRDIEVVFIKERKVNLHTYADQDIGASVVNA
jgi:hypothetical protein